MRARKLGLIPQVRKHKTKGDMTESRTAERCEDSRSYRLGGTVGCLSQYADGTCDGANMAVAEDWMQ